MQSRSLLPATAFNVSNMSTAGIEEVIMRIVPNYDPSNEEMKQFYIELLRCWTALGSPMKMVPRVGQKELDLFYLWNIVQGYGGLKETIARRLWKDIAPLFTFPGPCANSAYMLKVNFVRYLGPYEMFRVHGKTIEEIGKWIRDHPNDYCRGPGSQIVNAHRAIKQGATPTAQRFLQSASNATPTVVALAPYGGALSGPEVSARADVPVKDYSLFVPSVGSKRRLDASNAGIAPLTKRVCTHKEPDKELQRQLGTAVRTGDSASMNWAFRVLKLFSYTVEMKVQGDTGLVDALARVLEYCRVYLSGVDVTSDCFRPRPSDAPASVAEPILEYNMMRRGLLYGHREDGASRDRGCALLFDIEPSQCATGRQALVVGIIHNLVQVAENKRVFGQHDQLMTELARVVNDPLCDAEVSSQAIQVFDVAAKYLTPASTSSGPVVNAMVNALGGETKHMRVGLDFFLKLSERSENEFVFVEVNPSFYSHLLHLLGLEPQAPPTEAGADANDSEHLEQRSLQFGALSLLHNISSYKGAASVRAAKVTHCIKHLIRLLGEPAMAMRAALTLLNFCSYNETAQRMCAYESYLALMLFADNEAQVLPARVANLVLKMLAKLGQMQPSAAMIRMVH